jgi:hypothetical protein
MSTIFNIKALAPNKKSTVVELLFNQNTEEISLETVLSTRYGIELDKNGPFSE